MDKKLLLHVCCAPCSGGIIETLLEEGYQPTAFFYNPNIYPLKEYVRRKDEIKRFLKDIHIPFIDADYDPEYWHERIKGTENAPERGLRCGRCFDMRLERAALYAHENGFTLLATTNGISRWKDIQQVNNAGTKAVAQYPEVSFLAWNWRIKGGSDRMIYVSKREKFYQQDYCGCIFSFEQSTIRKNNKTL